MDEVKALNDAYAQFSEQPLGPVQAVIMNAVLTLERKFSPEQYDEETITAALLGAIAGGFPWVARAIGTRHDEPMSVMWGQYKKSGPPSGAAAGSVPPPRDDSEFTHGADFALALRLTNARVRLALFQAKRQTTKARRLTICHSGKKGEQTNRQFLNLKKFSFGVVAGVKEKKPVLEDLHWVHYLGYLKSGPRCVSICQLAHHPEVRDDEVMTNSFSVPVLVSHPSLMSVLRDGIRDANNQPVGWLDMTDKEARTLFPLLRDLMPVYVAEETDKKSLLTADAKIWQVFAENHEMMALQEKPEARASATSKRKPSA